MNGREFIHQMYRFPSLDKKPFSGKKIDCMLDIARVVEVPEWFAKERIVLNNARQRNCRPNGRKIIDDLECGDLTNASSARLLNEALKTLTGTAGYNQLTKALINCMRETSPAEINGSITFIQSFKQQWGTIRPMDTVTIELDGCFFTIKYWKTPISLATFADEIKRAYNMVLFEYILVSTTNKPFKKWRAKETYSLTVDICTKVFLNPDVLCSHSK